MKTKQLKTTAKKMKVVLAWEPSPSDNVTRCEVAVMSKSGKLVRREKCDPDQDHITVELEAGQYVFVVHTLTTSGSVPSSELAFTVSKDMVSPATNLTAYAQPKEDEEEAGKGKLPDIPENDDVIPCSNKTIEAEASGESSEEADEDGVDSFEQGMAQLERMGSKDDN